MKYTDVSCRQFIESLASQDPVPGGGSVAALVGALGAALGDMVGALTVEKKKYSAVAEEIRDAMNEVSLLQKDLIELVQKDIEIFEPISKILAMKPETEEETKKKEELLEVALEEACSVPIMVMGKCGRVVELCKLFAEKGNRIAVSDAAAGAILCKSAIEAASLNVYINTSMMKNSEKTESLNNVCARHLMMYTPLAEGVFGYVSHRLQTNEA
ncbi:MAG: cyclodeaminase/cyclohydrolase family protein [Clostridiales bacterium]|nr:cyclodeaminase/cyclohydrolase family protein [Clostridiales bacterium]